MSKKNRKPQILRELVELKVMKKEEVQNDLLPSAEVAEPGTVDAIVAAFLSSQLVADLTAAKKLDEEAEELKRQRRALAKEQQELLDEKGRLAIRFTEANKKVGDINVRKHTLRSNTKNEVMNNPKVAEWRAMAGKGFNALIEQLTTQAMASDARGQELMANGLQFQKEAEKLQAALNKVQAKLDRIAKKENRLIADVDGKLVAIKTLKEAHNG